MNEKKFRAWNFKDRIYYYSHAKKNDALANLHDFQKLEIFFNVLNEFKNQFENLEQSIGIKDKNGKEMYEGDIVKFDDKLYFIEFWLGAFCLTDKDEKSVVHFPIADYYSEEIENMEIIGNIFENKDLLNGSF